MVVVAGMPKPKRVVLKKDYVRGHANAHKRIYTKRGKASWYLCIDCGGAARHWSYNYSGVHEVYRRASKVTVARYSNDVRQYDPRCAPCHHRFDARYREQGREAVLQWVLDRDSTAPPGSRDGYGARRGYLI